MKNVKLYYDYPDGFAMSGVTHEGPSALLDAIDEAVSMCRTEGANKGLCVRFWVDGLYQWSLIRTSSGATVYDDTNAIRFTEPDPASN